MADLDAAIFLKNSGAVDVCHVPNQHALMWQVKRKRDEERQTLLAKQEKESPWFVPPQCNYTHVNRQLFMEPGELIIKTGLVDKRKVVV